MPSRLGRVTATLAATALIVPTVALAARGGGHPHGHGQTFTLNAVQTVDEFLDLGASGLTSGDQIIFATAVSRDGRPAGVTGGSCTVTTIDPNNRFTASCQATARLGGGLITTQALVTFRGDGGLQPPFTLAITGGTGRYSGADGEVEVRQISDTTENYIVRLDRR